MLDGLASVVNAAAGAAAIAILDELRARRRARSADSDHAARAAQLLDDAERAARLLLAAQASLPTASANERPGGEAATGATPAGRARRR